MENILFFDSNKEVKKFATTCPCKNCKYIFFSDSFSEISLKKLKPYLDARVISVFTHSSLIQNERLDLFKNLQFIATRSTGFNHIDLNYCKKRNILVSNVPQYGAITVAEFAFGLILDLERKIMQANQDMRCNLIKMPDYTGFDLADKTIGIIGTGSIGQHMIKIAQGFNMKVLAYDIFQQKNLKKFYVSNLNDLYKNSDIISLHIPSTKENYHLLDKKAFQKMKKDVLIINTARGDLIDSFALYEAIMKHKVAGAGLDVVENEDFLLRDEAETSPNLTNQDFLLTSTINLKLMQLKNVIITPHIAFNSFDAIRRINATTCQNIQNFLKGTPINLQSVR